LLVNIRFMKISVFWDVIPCCWASRSCCFEGSPCLHFHCHAVKRSMLNPEVEGTTTKTWYDHNMNLECHEKTLSQNSFCRSVPTFPHNP
jgi:hypothetical protein